MDGGTVTITFKGDDKDLQKKVNSVKADLTDSLGSVKNIVAGMGITQLIGKAFNTLNANLDGAITRLDTMNNFPKVMKNLGINVEESEKAISILSDKLTGLPTTLDSATIGVQRLVSKNGDLKKSTDIFLAMNNAIIAGGANATIQSSAVEQLTQAYSKGKMDMMEWRTIQMAMPAQLKQVASAMGLQVDELGEMMRQGDMTQETMDEFIETIIKLNSEGVEGFANFEEQARGSVSGIATSITNMKTAIVRGVANTLDSVNQLLDKNGLPSIAEIIQNITKVINTSFKTINGIIANSSLKDIGKFAGLIGIVPFVEKFANLMPLMGKGITKATNSFNAFGNSFKKVFSNFQKNHQLLMFFPKLLQSEFMAHFPKMSEAIKMTTSLLGKLGGAGISALGKLGKLGGIATKLTGLTAIGGIIITALGSLGTETTKKITEIINNVASKGPEMIKSFFDNITASLPTMIANGQAIITALLNALSTNAEPIINGIMQMLPILSEALLNMLPQLLQTVLTIAIQLITSLAEQLPVMLPQIIDAILGIIPILIDNLPLFFSAGAQLLGGLIAGMVNSIPILLARVGEIVVKIFSVFKSLDLKQIGADLLKGLWNGVKSMKDWVVDKVKGIGSSILGGLKGILGIHSPSTEFAIIGKYSILGYTEALDDMKSNVQNTIDDVFGIDPTMYNNASTHLSPNINMTVVNNMDFDPIGQVVNRVKTYSGGSKNDYNYGQGVS